jgi:hypothetical protein
MDNSTTSQLGWRKKGGVFLLFFTVETLVFAIITFGLWGAVLFHAAGDCLIIFPEFASM